VTLIAQAGCLLLYHLSQFGQHPFPELPLPVILMFGALFISPLFSLRRTLPAIPLRSVILLAFTLNIILSLGIGKLAGGTLLFLLAPLSGMLGAEVIPLVFGKRAAMVTAMTVYITCTLLANYTFDSFLPMPGYGLVNVGTLFFGITFTQRDRVHRYGRRNVYTMILLAAIANVAMALGLGTPLRYVAVGFTAIILSETADTEVYQRFLDRSWITRVASSNAVSIPTDTIVFTVFAFAGESFATPAWMTEVIVTDIIVKAVVGFLAAIGVTSPALKVETATRPRGS